MNLVTFFQPTPRRIRYFSVVAETLTVIFFVLLFSPVNIAIEAFSLVAALVGIFRLDIKWKNRQPEAKEQQTTESNEKAQSN